MKRILIAGIGNILDGDDAFGVEVARALATRPQRAGVTVKEFGIRAYDLAQALIDGHDAVLLVDAAPHGHAPGTVYLIEPEVSRLADPDRAAEGAHALNPSSILQLARSLGELSGRLLVVGCEPAIPEREDGEPGLSEPVQAAVPVAVELIESVVDELLDQPDPKTSGLVPA